GRPIREAHPQGGRPSGSRAGGWSGARNRGSLTDAGVPCRYPPGCSSGHVHGLHSLTLFRMNAPDAVLQHLADLGLGRTQTVYYNLTPPRLYEIALRRGEGRLAQHGPLVARTDPHTGRSPNDRFIVREPSSEGEVGWGSVNKPVSEALFDRLLSQMGRYATGRDVFVRDCYAGADP